MADEVKDENPEESSPLEDAGASSSEATEEAGEVSGTATPQQAETQPEEEKEPPFHEHPRWKELQEKLREKEESERWYRQQLERAMANQQQPTLQQPQTPQADPYANMTAEEKVFYQNLDERVQNTIQKEIDKREQTFRQIIGGLMTKQFRKDYPDIKLNSVEEREIAEKIRMGYSSDDAYKIVMWDKKIGEKQQTEEQRQKQRLEAKKKANIVSSQSVSPSTTPPKKETWKEEFNRRMDTDWDGTI